MMTKVLVAYASKYGSTAEIAAAIANTLNEKQLDVKVVSADAVRDISGYDAVVVGSAVYAGHWVDKAVQFLETFQDELQHKPVWLFSSGPTGEGSANDLLGGWRFPDGLQPLVDKIGVQDTAVFHGKIDPDKLNLAERLLVRAMRGATGDYRRWDEIRLWALSMTEALVTA